MIKISKIEKCNYKEALSLTWQVFQDFEAPDYEKEGVEEFYKSIHDENYLNLLSMFGAYSDQKLVGVIATRSEGKHIALFFVDKNYQHQGIGKKLFESILNQDAIGTLTVFSSPYAIPIYHKLGFVDTDKEQSVNGLRFTPMIYKPKNK